MRLAWGEAGSCTHDDPGETPITGRFPGIGEGSQSVDVCDGAHINLQGDGFGGCRRQDARQTCGRSGRPRSLHITIGETEDLDVAQGVDPIEQASGKGRALIGHGDGVVRIADDGVISSVATEDRQVNSRGAPLDRAMDAQL